MDQDSVSSSVAVAAGAAVDSVSSNAIVAVCVLSAVHAASKIEITKPANIFIRILRWEIVARWPAEVK